jgi:hypothetical protein
VARGNLYISFLDAGGVFSVDLAAIVAAFFAVPDYEGITTMGPNRAAGNRSWLFAVSSEDTAFSLLCLWTRRTLLARPSWFHDLPCPPNYQ